MDGPGLPTWRTDVSRSGEVKVSETGTVSSTSVQSRDDAGAIIQRIEMIAFKTVSWTVYDSDGHAHPGPEHPADARILVVGDMDGVEGYCLCSGDPLRPMILDNFVRKAIVGEDAFNREMLWQRLYRMQRGSGGALTDRALGYVDQALWDLAGRKLDIPVWKLIGGARSSVPAYASTMCGDDIEGGLRTPEDYGDFAESLIAGGYQAIKLHTWMPPVPFAPDPGMDARACAAVREAVGPDIPLMLDANHWYSRVDALRLGRALQALDFYWYEEPMEEASISSYRWLADQLDIPIIGPESAAGRVHTRAEWVKAGACDILRVGVNDTGGITPALKIVHLAEAFNMQAEVHEGGSGNLALLGATSNSRWYERGLLHPHFDYEAVPPHLNSIIDSIDGAGEIPMCLRPGLGDDLCWSHINDNVVARW
jgi:L-alanine-DL-glutamate epimerase-like enolase superfamily enzyme